MIDPFFEYFHKDRPDSLNFFPDAFKTYPMAQRIVLPKPKPLAFRLEEALLKRKSERNFSEKPLPLDTLGTLLFWGAGLMHSDNPIRRDYRPYPSGGARYPVEIYLALLRGENIDSGIYHYCAKNHALELLSGSPEAIRGALTYDFAKYASAIILFSFIKKRVWDRYERLGYKLGLLEGGHIGQNFYLVGTALHLGILSLAGMDYEAAKKKFDLPEGEDFFYQMAVGFPADEGVDK